MYRRQIEPTRHWVPHHSKLKEVTAVILDSVRVKTPSPPAAIRQQSTGALKYKCCHWLLSRVCCCLHTDHVLILAGPGRTDLIIKSLKERRLST